MTRKTWKEFQSHGLLLIINQMLHLFGWAIVFQYDNGEVVDVYPARVKFRGFDNEDVSEAYKNATNYLSDNIKELKDEANS